VVIAAREDAPGSREAARGRGGVVVLVGKRMEGGTDYGLRSTAMSELGDMGRHSR
jgi:hypothetical protein